MLPSIHKIISSVQRIVLQLNIGVRFSEFSFLKHEYQYSLIKWHYIAKILCGFLTETIYVTIKTKRTIRVIISLGGFHAEYKTNNRVHGIYQLYQ